jgi:4a-hydroxytetrahydrobiopterin dehydratase
MYVGAKAREVGHHPDIDIRWQRIRFSITTHDAGNRITVRDFEMAAHIDAIAAGHGAKPVPPEGG